MLEVLQGLVQQYGQQAVVQNNAVPNVHNEGVMDEVLSGIMGGFTNQANSQGGLGSLLGLLGGQQGGGNLMNNPIVGSISSNIIGSLMSKFGLSNSAAVGVVTSMLPGILGSLISKTNDPNDNSIDMGSLMGAVSGGRTQGIDFSTIMGAASGALADGKLDMNDLINLASGNSGNQQTGGLGSLLGGLFGK